jgi:hypothetical protein
MHLFATTTAERMLQIGKQAAVVETESMPGARSAVQV